MDLTVKTGPTTFSIDRALVKAMKRVRHGQEDSLIDFWIKAADEYVEKRTNRALMKQTLVLRLSRILPVVQLPRPPLLSVVSMTFAESDGTAGTVAVDPNAIRVDRMLATIDTGLTERAGTMTVEFEAGASSPENVPAMLRQASALMVTHWHVNREATYADPRIMNVSKKTEFGVDALVKELRVPNAHELNGGW